MLLAMCLPNILEDERVQMILTAWKETPGFAVRWRSTGAHPGSRILRVRRAHVREAHKNGARMRYSCVRRTNSIAGPGGPALFDT